MPSRFEIHAHEGIAKLIVSACLLGENCKYSGGNNRCARLIEVLAEHPEFGVIPVCPEVAGGLPTPRPPAEIVNGHVTTIEGDDVDEQFRAGVAAEMERLAPAIDAGEVRTAILQSRSPSCGVNQVYDGTFTGTLIAGQGLFAQALADAGIHLVDVADLLQ